MSSVSFRRETQTIKKALPPGQKKAGFSCGALLGVFPNIVGKVSRVRAQSCPKGYAKKRSKHHGLGVTGSSLPLYAGKLWAKKETPLPLMGEYSPRGPAGGRFSNSGGFYCKGGMIYTVPLLPVCFPAFHQPFLHAALLKIPGKPPRPVIGCCFQHFLPQTQHNGLSP